MKLIIGVVLVTVTASCIRQPDYLAQALELAGGNRSELEKVLCHYKQETIDSLKYRAAVFLISNMAGHYSCAGNSMESYYDELDSLSIQYAGRTGDTVQLVFERLGEKYLKSYPQTIPDLRSIKAGYLIKNIDKAFDTWENTCWLENLDFDDFCEYILPYKVCEAQTLDNWREYYIKDGKNIAKQGKVMGIKGEGKDRQPENLYDNDPLTCYEAPAPSDCWSGLDFGEPINIDRILYAPRADGNCVTYGDEYELKYWKKDRWVSLGRKTAGSIYPLLRWRLY